MASSRTARRLMLLAALFMAACSSAEPEADTKPSNIVVFSSDNGPALGLNGRFRVGKSPLLEVRVRMPFIWAGPGVSEPSDSAALISQVHLYALLAALTGHKQDPAEAIDSEDQLHASQGRDLTGLDGLFKEVFVSHSLRKGQIKYSPGKSKQAEPASIARDKGIESAWSAEAQLSNLASNPARQVNLASGNPELDVAMKRETQRRFSRTERTP